MDKPLVGADARCAAHDRAHENVGMKLALDQAADAAILNTGDGGFDSALFTFGIDDVSAGQVPSQRGGIGANLVRLAKQDRTGEPGRDRIARGFQNGGADRPDKPDRKRIAASSQRQKVGRAGRVGFGQERACHLPVANRHERLPPNPQSGISAGAAPKCCLGVSLSIPARYSATGLPAKFFDRGRKPIHAFGDPRLGNG